MTKLITLLAFLYLFIFTIADQQTIRTSSLDFDDNDDDVLTTEPLFLDVAESVDIKAIEEASKVEVNNCFEPVEPVETEEEITLTIVEEEAFIALVEETDIQGAIVVDGGEVIVDYTENGEVMQAEVEQEEAMIDYVENGELIVQVEDDITEGTITNIALVDNEEDDITQGTVVNAVLVENEEGGFIAVIANPGDPTDDEEHKLNEETDIINDGEIPVLVLENAEDEILNEEATIVLVNEESEITAVIAFADVRADDEEEEPFVDSEESDDANEGEIPVLPEESQVAQVLANPGLPGDDEEEEADITSQESDDANEGEIPILPDEQQVTQVLANPGLPGDDEEEEADITSQESDDANEGEILVVPDEQEVIQGFVDPNVKADDEEEEPIDTDGVEDGEPDQSDVVVVFPEDQAAEDGVTPGIVNTQEFADDAGEELADDVDARDDYEPDGGAADAAVGRERRFLRGN